MQETSPSPDSSKADWRKWSRQILSSISKPNEQSEEIRQRISVLLHEHRPRWIAAFSALPDEPSLLELIQQHPHYRWVFPRVVDEDLVFHQVGQLDDLQTGAFGILEPKHDLPVVSIAEIDVFLCPGLGFDRRGFRLGRGKGFYDRALSAAKSEALRVGTAFREQVINQLPVEGHDIPMTHLCSPDGLVTLPLHD